MINNLTPRIPIRNAIPLMALSAALIALALLALTSLEHRPAHAAPAGAYERWLWLKCVDEEVQEGDSFRLEVRRDGGIPSDLQETIRVKWYTDAGTAGESDYHALDGNTQASNRYQTRVGKMGRTLYTREDNLKEKDETFTVRIENTGNEDNSDSCEITIIDDD